MAKQLMNSETRGRWIFAIGKHLTAFQQNALLAQLYATQKAARHGDLLLRLRRLGRVSGAKFEALALDAGIPRQELATVDLEATALVDVATSGGAVHHVDERIFTEQAVFRAVTFLFERSDPRPVEGALVDLTDLLSGLPLSEDEILARMAMLGHSDQISRKAIEIAQAFRLLESRIVGDFGGALYYNEYLWGHKIERIAPVLTHLGSRETSGLLDLMEEIRQAQGTALDRLSAAPPNIVQLAAGTGIIDTVTINTTSGRNKTFTFSPMFHGFQTGRASPLSIDTADQVKLMVASLEYGIRYSEDFRLNRPVAFLDRLLREGTAGDATPIGRDYILLEKQGIISTEPTSGSRARFVLVKEDIVRTARDIFVAGDPSGAGPSGDSRFLVQQQGFNSPEHNRITQFAREAPSVGSVESDILAAIREDVQKGRW